MTLWSKIKSRRTCKFCGHLSSLHRRLDSMSELVETDIWTCEGCSAEERTCIGRVGLGKVLENVKKKRKDDFGGGRKL